MKQPRTVVYSAKRRSGGFRSQADAENCILTCGKAHYAYCLMEMAENRHNLREQCRRLYFAERTSLRDW